MKIIDKLKASNVHVVGVTGAEGSAVAEWLTNNGVSKVTAHDICSKEGVRESYNSFHDFFHEEEKAKSFEELMALPIAWHFSNTYLKGIKQADIIFVPQSWFRYSENDPIKKIQGKVELWSITKLYMNLVPCEIIGVTGTSGKSTTSRIIYEVLKNSGRKVYFSGNDRQNVQILDKISEIRKNDILVLEISNRQLLIDLDKSPHIGVITNISPNHLDDHKDFDDYILTKKRLLDWQSKSDFAVLNADCNNTKGLADLIRSTPYFFSLKDKVAKGAYIFHRDIIVRNKDVSNKICSIDDLNVHGPHNKANVLAASVAGLLAGVSTKNIRSAVIAFKGIPYRHEFVRELNRVKYYDDTAACNPDGPRVTAESFKAPLILIMGGARKRPYPGEFDEMAAAIVRGNVIGILLIGEMAKEIEKALRKKIKEIGKYKFLIKKCESLAEAVGNAKTMSKPQGVVVFSPGCESFDMFADYRDRSRAYKELVNNLT